MDSSPALNLTPLTTQQRRVKRLVPDTQKDDSYWQRRHRNNIAAKKSRENRRQFEGLIRTRVTALEEENCLLKRELELLKQRLNIPENACILSETEREECLRECRRKDLINNTYKRQESFTINVEAYDERKIPNHSEQENSWIELDTKNIDLSTPACTNAWAITPQHFQSLQSYAESSKIFRTEVTNEDGVNEPHGIGIKRKRKEFEEENTSCSDKSSTCIRNQSSGGKAYNLSVQSNDSSKLTNDRSNTRKQENYTATKDQRSSSDFPETCNEPIDLTKDMNDNDNINSEIKSKLQLLSDQVERMQKLVCTG